MRSQYDNQSSKRRKQTPSEPLTNPINGIGDSSRISDSTNALELEEYLSNWQSHSEYNNDSQDLANDRYYFNSYSHFGIHDEMIRDNVRTDTYRRAIMQNHHLFKDQLVLDVGCGTGILALFAIKAGAKHVYCIECSAIINVAKRIADFNNISDKITFVEGRAEEVELPVQSVDILLSEWMGYFLLYENMLESVLFCRDKWLKSNGLIFPDKASIFIAGIEDSVYKSEKFNFWNYVYGFDFSCIKQDIMEEPIVDNVDQNAVATSYHCLLELDLKTCTKENLQFSSNFKLIVSRNEFIHAFVVWFDVVFSASHSPIGFTTSPFGPSTHWKQTVFYIKDDLIAKKDEVIEGSIAVRPAVKNPRALDIAIQYSFHGANSHSNQLQVYKLR